MRIAVGGFHHETNTFAPTKATFEMFERADGWPGLARGAGLFDAVAGINIPAAGYVEAARAAGHELVPLVWCNASPSAHVTRDAYERVAGMMLSELAAAGRVDAVYLDLHGAMVTEHLEDGEGELIERVRGLVGDSVPIVASLDLHANVTREMVDGTDALVGFRTYPHVDMADTGRRAARVLDRILERGVPHKAFRKLPFLIPINWQCTLIEPARSVYGLLERLEGGQVLSLSFTPGFPPADIHDCGPAVMAYGWSETAAEAAADALADAILRREPEFDGAVWQPEAAVAEARRIAAAAGRPVVIADTQDNPGAGGDGDTVGMLAALVRGEAQRAVFGLLCDPGAAAAAHEAGEGGEFEAALGGRSGAPGDAPFPGRFAVERLGDGRFTGTGPFYGGSRMDLGQMALLRVRDPAADVRVVLCSRKVQAADQAMFRHVGIEPASARILVLKSSVHFRADFGPIAETVLIALAPGPVPALPTDYAYRHLRRGVRLGPRGPAFTGPSA